MQELLMSLLQLVTLLFNPMFLIILMIVIIVLIRKNREYKNGAYYQITKLPYLAVKYNVGRYGEYLTYKHLRQFETDGAKFLFNIYVPKENGETTEIDVLMVCKKGVFVFESKNYSGWIFGGEDQKNWYQTLPSGKGRSHKEHFYNPIMQNRSHIRHLKAFLGEQVPMRSIIVFSDRCTLKSVQVHSEDVSVVNRCHVSSVVSNVCDQIPNNLLTDSEIAEIYSKLYPYTQVDEIAKMQHIANINNNLHPQPVQEIGETPVQTAPQGQAEEALEQPNTVTVSEPEAEAAMERKEPYGEETNREPFLCPLCGGRLVKRSGPYGDFFGCSNYRVSGCKYKRKLR